MSYEVKMPQLGLTMEEGTVGQWHKKEGDIVKKGDILLEIETDKITTEMESEFEGVLLQIVAKEGAEIPVQGLLAYIGQEGELPRQTPKIEEAVRSSLEIEKPSHSGAGTKKVAVIGGGPGGYVAAIRLAQLGGKVTLIEKNRLGGTCLNVGCIPTKVLLHDAELIHSLKEAEDLGIKIDKSGFDWSRVQKKKQQVSDQLVMGVGSLMKSHGIEVIEGTASFVSAKKLSILKNDGSRQEFEADNIIIASGSVPAIPPIEGVKGNPNCLDSTGALELPSVPKTLLVIGGGVIGIELATAYSGFGTKVTVIEALPKLLPLMDGELTSLLSMSMKNRGIDILTNAKVLSVENLPSGVKATIETEAGEKTFEAEKVLVAVGRRVATEELNLEAAGIAHDRGKILVDEFMKTTAEGVYAIGDCLGKVMLAHVASAQGETAAENIMGTPKRYDGRTNPSCVYTEPEFSGVGLTEEQAKEQNIEYEVGKFPLSSNGKALIMGGEGIVKVIVGKEYKEILGVHILGPRATDLIGEGALAIGMEAAVEDLIETIHAHPTLTEAVREAVLASENIALHLPKPKKK